MGKKAGGTEESPNPEGKLETSTETKETKVATSTKEPETSQGKKEGKSSKSEDRTFSQDEVNELVGKVRGDATEKATKAFFKDLGVENVDALKGSLTELADIKREALTEQERMQADLDTATEKIKSLDADRRAALEVARRAAVDTHILRVAEDKFQSNDLVLKVINRDEIKIDDAGQIVGVAEALTDLATSHPFMLQQADKVLSVTSTANPDGSEKPVGKTDDEWRADLFNVRRTLVDLPGGRKVEVDMPIPQTEFFKDTEVRFTDRASGEISEFHKQQAAEAKKAEADKQKSAE